MVLAQLVQYFSSSQSKSIDATNLSTNVTQESLERQMGEKEDNVQLRPRAAYTHVCLNHVLI